MTGEEENLAVVKGDGDTISDQEGVIGGHNMSDKVWGMPQFKEDPLMNSNISNEEFLAMVRYRDMPDEIETNHFFCNVHNRLLRKLYLHCVLR